MAAGGLILLLIAPLCGLPVAVPGIPVWYQDTFFIALICGGGGKLNQSFALLCRFFSEGSLEFDGWFGFVDFDL